MLYQSQFPERNLKSKKHRGRGRGKKKQVDTVTEKCDGKGKSDGNG